MAAGDEPGRHRESCLAYRGADPCHFRDRGPGRSPGCAETGTFPAHSAGRIAPAARHRPPVAPGGTERSGCPHPQIRRLAAARTIGALTISQTKEITMYETEIISIPILPLNMVNAHLIRSEAGCILVDAGIPGSEHKIARVLHRHGLTFRDIKLIVVTHAHTDHAGSAARLRELSGAPILGHKDDADFYSRKERMTYCATGWVGKLFFKTPVP